MSSKVIFILFCSLVVLLSCPLARAQHYFKDKEYARSPLWMNMIYDSSANYFEVQKAFRIYWQHHEMTEGEAEEMQAMQTGRLTRRKRKALMEVSRMEVAVKQYAFWLFAVRPYVRPDGSIMPLARRMEIRNELAQTQQP